MEDKDRWSEMNLENRSQIMKALSKTCGHSHWLFPNARETKNVAQFNRGSSEITGCYANNGLKGSKSRSRKTYYSSIFQVRNSDGLAYERCFN